ncbi:uncharacterized protein LOC119999032 isoform X2 [Tripterygium wilfordii]|uniref:uncharacterized protein LOC119999032 isoform X2 n=1 Tax=Tripterygium wilfordii TaxID=458696 RepID=UPI0018F8065A|nr:uncharacterized protein LOC119999032 isoform X2 [Tripterygium wilfordii]
MVVCLVSFRPMEVDGRKGKKNSKGVAWYWVIEYFSTLKEVDASILRGAKTREVVALRCLEELFDPLPDPATVDAQANGHFDFSRGFEEVLTYILRRASISELKSGAPESLTSCAIPFIIHKRASMGQAALSKLKDELVRGTHPFAPYLSKGSRLVLANVQDNDDIVALPLRSPSEANADDQVSEVPERLVDMNLDNVDGNADVQVSKVQEIHNGDVQVSVVQKSLIATTHDNVDDEADVQVSKAQESLLYTSFDDGKGNADAQVSLIAFDKVDGDGDGDAQVSTAQENLICTTLDDANGNSDAQVAEAQESLIDTILNNVDGNAGHQVSKAQESLIYTTHDDANGNADSQVVEAQVSLIPTILENVDGAQRHDMHAEEFFPRKRKSNDFPDKYVDGQSHEIENQGDLDGRYDHYLVTKKIRLDPSCGNQIVAEASKGVRKYSELGGLEESRSLEIGHDERLGLVSDIHGNSNLQPNTDKVSRGASGNETDDFLSVGVVSDGDLRASSVVPALKTQNIDSNLHEIEPDNTMEHLPKEDTEFDNDGYDNEGLKVSEKEGNIFNSPCKVNHGSSQVSESPVLNFCVKCNKEGSLLVCGSSDCSLGIHESCLGSSVKFDDQGNFYCPFCAYSRALSEYRKCTESVSSAKKELNAFFNMNAIHQPKEHAEKLYRGQSTTILDSTNQGTC